MANVGFSYYDNTNNDGAPPYASRSVFLTTSNNGSVPDGHGNLFPNHSSQDTDSPDAHGTYYAYAVVKNSGNQGAVWNAVCSFFLADPATAFDLSSGIFLGQGGGTGPLSAGAFEVVSPVPSPVNFGNLDLRGQNHWCLVAGWQWAGLENTYLDSRGKAKPGVVASLNDPHNMVQHNVTVSDVGAGRSSGFADIGVVGTVNPSSLIVRLPNRVEHGAMVRTVLEGGGVGFEEVTADSQIGLLEDGPWIGEPEGCPVEGLPQKVDLKGLEAGCFKKIGIALQLPKKRAERSAAIWLIEQVTSDGTLIGGIVFVAKNVVNSHYGDSGDAPQAS